MVNDQSLQNLTKEENSIFVLLLNQYFQVSFSGCRWKMDVDVLYFLGSNSFDY